MHLIDRLRAKDSDNLGKLHLEDIMQIFDSDDEKMQLSKMQKYVIRSAFEVNELGKV